MEPKIKELWTVENGEYSDHQVMAVFETEKDAEEWKKALAEDPDGWHQSAYIGKIAFVPSKCKPFKTTTYKQIVELWDNGKIEYREIQEYSEYPIGYNTLPPVRPQVRYVRAPFHHNKGGRLEVVGKSRKIVEKVIQDRIARWKSGDWAGKQHTEINEEV